MTTIAIVELVSAAFLGVILLRLVSERVETEGNKCMKITLLLCILALVSDAMAYTLVGPGYPVALRYFINLLAFEAGTINALGFTLYARSFITERKKLNPWVFRGVLIIEFIWMAAVAYEFVSGRFITYVDGIEQINYSIPVYLQLLSIASIAYLSVVALVNRKSIGTDIAMLFCVFNLSPVIGIFVANYTAYDFTYVFGAIALAFTVEFIQKKQLLEHEEQQQILSDGLAREYHTVWLMDGFGDHKIHLYRSTGKTTVQSAVQLGLSQPCFDKYVVQYIRDNVLEEDQERVIEETRFETIERETPEVGTYVVSYRRYTDNRKDYTYHQMCFARAAGKDGSTNYIVAFRDADTMLREQIAQQKQLEEALSRTNAEAALREMVYKIGDLSPWSYEIGRDDAVLSVSYSDRLIEDIKANPSGDSMGWVKLVHPEDKDRVVNGFMSAICDHSGNTLYDESYRILADDGEYRWVRSVGRVIRKPDGTGEFIGMATDFTAQIKEQEKQQEQLEKALDMADAANKAKTDFLFNMSHDIRTPMNAIIGFTNIAKKEIDNREKALDSLDKVQVSSDILLNLINDVLDMSRIESGKVELHESKYEIVEAYDNFEPAMANLAEAKGVDLSFEIGEMRDRFIFADGPRFDRVLINIISNAIKYTPKGGFVRVTAEQIEDTQPGYGNYRFTVTDSGIGMSEEFQKHMFENFSREDNSSTREIQGTGLGLALAKKLVDLMGGTISCVSTQGIGTTFTIVFPFRLQTEADRLEEGDIVREQEEINLKGKRALLVEDNELNREIAVEILSDEGIIVETASDGQKAVNKVREHGTDYYDFVLMDIQMPVMDGYEATRMIRKLMPGWKAPIIALSANAFSEDKEKSKAAGMSDHVAKPIDINELLGALSKCL